MGRILRKFKQLRLRPFDRSDNTAESERVVENTDALAALPQVAAQYPPGYVKDDDGRPRH
jgi:hypothetical protein